MSVLVLRNPFSNVRKSINWCKVSFFFFLFCRMDSLQRHMPVAGQDGVEELLKIAWRFEEKIFQAATDQAIFLGASLSLSWVSLLLIRKIVLVEMMIDVGVFVCYWNVKKQKHGFEIQVSSWLSVVVGWCSLCHLTARLLAQNLIEDAFTRNQGKWECTSSQRCWWCAWPGCNQARSSRSVWNKTGIDDRLAGCLLQPTGL